MGLVQGRPLLDYLIESAQHARSIGKIVIGTSTDPSDDAIERYCRSKEIDCVRGDLGNVARRYEKIVRQLQLSSFVRISADSPLLDFRLIDRATTLFNKDKPAIATNVLTRTFPKGQSVEVVDGKIFLKNISHITDPLDQEHITRYFYRYPKNFSISNFESGGDWGKVQLSVDTQDDRNRIATLLSTLSRPHWKYEWKYFAQAA